MKKSILIFSLVVNTLLFCKASMANDAATLDPKIAMFANYIGTWESTFKMENNKPKIVDVANWQRALNGKAIRTLHSINDGEYGGESLIFWDSAQNKIVFYYFTTASFFTNGYIEVINEHSFVAYEDVSGSKQGITKVKSTSTLLDNKMQVSTSYFKNGTWTEPESRVYKPSNKAVNFK